MTKVCPDLIYAYHLVTLCRTYRSHKSHCPPYVRCKRSTHFHKNKLSSTKRLAAYWRLLARRRSQAEYSLGARGGAEMSLCSVCSDMVGVCRLTLETMGSETICRRYAREPRRDLSGRLDKSAAVHGLCRKWLADAHVGAIPYVSEIISTFAHARSFFVRTLLGIT